MVQFAANTMVQFAAERVVQFDANFAVMIYNEIPSFDVLMEFAQHLELEFNSWVVS